MLPCFTSKEDTRANTAVRPWLTLFFTYNHADKIKRKISQNTLFMAPKTAHAKRASGFSTCQRVLPACSETGI